MEFNVFEQFKGFERTGEAPRTPEEQGTRFFLGGHLGPRLEPHIDDAAARARMSRRNFLATASALPAAMLAVNKVTGMRFFDVTPAEAYEPAAAKEIKINRKPGQDFIFYVLTKKYYPLLNQVTSGFQFKLGGAVFCSASRQESDLLTSRPLPPHFLTTSYSHSRPTVARAAMRFWIASRARG